MPKNIMKAAQLFMKGASLGALSWLCLACAPQDMHDQPRFDPLEATGFFPDSMSARPLAPNSVSRGHLPWTGQGMQGVEEFLASPAWLENLPPDTIPFALTPELLERGATNYQIHCTPCHGPYGEGDGFVTTRGFPAPPSFHQERLRTVSNLHFYRVITEGFGRMYPYGYRVKPPERWAVIAYVRALQLARHARIEDAPRDSLSRLEAMR